MSENRTIKLLELYFDAPKALVIQLEGKQAISHMSRSRSNYLRIMHAGVWIQPQPRPLTRGHKNPS